MTSPTPATTIESEVALYRRVMRRAMHASPNPLQPPSWASAVVGKLSEEAPRDPRSHLLAVIVQQCMSRRGHVYVSGDAPVPASYVVRIGGPELEPPDAQYGTPGITISIPRDAKGVVRLDCWPVHDSAMAVDAVTTYVDDVARYVDGFLDAVIEAPFYEGLALTGRSGQTYTVGGPIGVGGTAVVCSATSAGGEQVAAKALSGHRFVITDASRSRFLREAEHLASIDHPHVLRAVDIAIRHRHVVLLTEYADDSLYDRLKLRPADDAQALAWLHQILQGVRAIHACNLVHRDLTPKNLLFMPDGRLVVADFGTVRAFDDVTLTVAADRLGSLIYVSAQQAENAHAATASDDLFSVGQVAWHMLTGRRPGSNAPPLAVMRPDLPTELTDLVESLRAFEPGGRPANAVVALAALEDIIP